MCATPRSFVNYLPGQSVSRVIGIRFRWTRAGDSDRRRFRDHSRIGRNVVQFPVRGDVRRVQDADLTFDAEYGRFGGGIEIYITKSGTNDFHGTTFLNMRRDIWNANSWANNARGVARPKDRLNEYGVAGGGPVWIPRSTTAATRRSSSSRIRRISGQ